MIGQSILRKVVGSNTLAAVARTGECLARIGAFLHLFLALVVIQATLEHAYGFSQILMLALFVLALDDDVGFVVSQPDSRFGLVDVLAAWAAGTKFVNAIVVRFEIDLDVLGLCQ